MSGMPSVTSVRVLADLAGDEDRTQGEGEAEPLDHAPARAGAAVRSTLGWRRSAAKTPIWQVTERQHEDDRVHERVGHVQLAAVSCGPQLGRGGAQGEVDREEAGEEHHLTAEPHDGADGDRIGPVDAGALAGA